jgi:hypothetical protein
MSDVNSDHKWINEKFNSVNDKIDGHGELLKKLVDGFDRLTQHETRIDVVEVNQSDHETRIRKIEQYMWVVVLMAAVFTGVAGKLSYDAVSIMNEAKKQRPMTVEEYSEATKQAITEALKEQSK